MSESSKSSSTIGDLAKLIAAIAALITALVGVRLPSTALSATLKVILYFVVLVFVGILRGAMKATGRESIIQAFISASFSFLILAMLAYGGYVVVHFVFFS